MPRPPNHHVCVCGWNTPYWAKMVHHRRGCDSYQEHREKLAGARGPEPTSEQEIVQWGCPHVDCIAFAHTLPDLISHMKWCSKIREGIDIAFAETDVGLGDFSHDLGLLVEFEAWCWRRDNGLEEAA